MLPAPEPNTSLPCNATSNTPFVPHGQTAIFTLAWNGTSTCDTCGPVPANAKLYAWLQSGNRIYEATNDTNDSRAVA